MHSSKCIDGAMYRSVCDSVEERSSNLALGPQHWGKAPSLPADGFFIGAPALSSCYPQCSPDSSSGHLLSLLSFFPAYTPVFDFLSCLQHFIRTPQVSGFQNCLHSKLKFPAAYWI